MPKPYRFDDTLPAPVDNQFEESDYALTWISFGIPFEDRGFKHKPCDGKGCDNCDKGIEIKTNLKIYYKFEDGTDYEEKVTAKVYAGGNYNGTPLSASTLFKRCRVLLGTDDVNVINRTDWNSMAPIDLIGHFGPNTKGRNVLQSIRIPKPSSGPKKNSLDAPMKKAGLQPDIFDPDSEEEVPL
jgi:hypothetical protein